MGLESTCRSLRKHGGGLIISGGARECMVEGSKMGGGARECAVGVSGCCGPALAIVGLCWLSLTFVGLSWPNEHYI